jgi:hypothetical protein
VNEAGGEGNFRRGLGKSLTANPPGVGYVMELALHELRSFKGAAGGP